MTRRVLIVGIDSMIGSATARELAEHGVQVVGTSRRRANPGHLFLDLTYDLSHWQVPSNLDAACIFAGVTALRSCERDPEDSRRVNVAGTCQLIERLNSAGVYVMFPSSNLVFSGAHAPFREEDPPAPLTEYGRQKASVEGAMRRILDRASILRFTKVLPEGFDLFAGWVRDLSVGRLIRPFADLEFSPITLSFTAQVIRQVCARQLTGVFHASGAQSITYAAAAEHIAAKIGVSKDLVRPISGREMQVDTEKMPRTGALSSQRLASQLGVNASDVWASINECVGLAPAKTRTQ